METNQGTVSGVCNFLQGLVDGHVHHDTGFRRNGLNNFLYETAERFGFTVLGSGSYRIAFTHPAAPGVVFKVETCWGSHNLAESEYMFYHFGATSVDRKYLAACLHFTESVCVMELVEGVVASSLYDGGGPKCLATAAENRFMSCVRKEYCANYFDAYSHNLIIKSDGTVVLFDYALN